MYVTGCAIVWSSTEVDELRCDMRNVLSFPSDGIPGVEGNPVFLCGASVKAERDSTRVRSITDNLI